MSKTKNIAEFFSRRFPAVETLFAAWKILLWATFLSNILYANSVVSSFKVTLRTQSDNFESAKLEICTGILIAFAK